MKMLAFIMLASMPVMLSGMGTPVSDPSAISILGPFWHGRSFVHRSSDAYGTTSTTIRFNADGASGSLETSGTVMGSAYSGRNGFDVVSISGTTMVIRYTSASDKELAPYIIGKKETITINSSRQTIEYNGDVFQ